MKKRAIVGLLAAGLILMPVSERAQTNTPDGPQFTLGELICVVVICGVLISITSCINHWANVPATSSPPPPDWPNPGPPPDPSTNGVPDDGDIDYALHHNVAMLTAASCTPITSGTVLDTNAATAVSITNYVTYTLQTGTDLAHLDQAYRFSIWQSANGQDIRVYGPDWTVLAAQYQPWGRTNPVFLPNLSSRTESQRYYRILSH